MNRVILLFKNNITFLKGVGVSILFVIILAVIMDLVVMPLYTHRGQEEELPDVTEMSYTEAEKLLKSSGFKIVKEREVFEATYPESTIVSQSPSAYSKVKKGRRIYVTLSAGERRVIVPNVTGISEREAAFQLRRAGLEIGEVYYEYNSYKPKDVVYEQSLTEGIEVLSGTVVSLTVSNGEWPNRFTVPDIRGKLLAEVIKILRQQGLKVGKIEYVLKRDLLPDTVIEQAIDPGDEVAQGRAIDITVSKLEEDSWE